MSDPLRPLIRFNASAWIAAVVLSAALPGCSMFSPRNELSTGYYLPLVAQLRHASSVTEAHVSYQDACGQPQSYPINALLQKAIRHKSGLVFEKVLTAEKGAVSTPVDGYVDVALGMTHTDLVIYRKATRSYPATVTLGLDFAYTDAEGTLLFGKKIQSSASGEVTVTADGSCGVKGLESIVQEAIAFVTDGMARHLGESTKIREQAASRQAGVTRPTSATPPPLSVQDNRIVPQPSPPPISAPAEIARSPATIPSDESSRLTFRAIFRDQNRNLLLHGGEAMTVEVEVKNEGPGTAQGIEIQVSGTSILTEHLPGMLSVGDLRPGEVKRVGLDGTIGTVKDPVQAELVLTLLAPSTVVQLPSPKKFLVAIKPESDAEAAMIPIDVDQLPKRAGKLKQPRAVGIAIGVGQFRETGAPRVKFAGRDAEVMGAYLKSVAGIPADRVRTLVDSQALKYDLVEALEEWLPKLVDPTTVVYVYFSGLGIVDSVTGAVSLIPFDGIGTTNPRLYSLRRLQEALTKLPVALVIMMLDVSLDPAAKTDQSANVAPVWDVAGSGNDRLMWMVGNRSIQEAHRYDPGQHGLFTYHLLKGLGGAADINRDGMILTGELCTYARGQVSRLAREQFGNEQEPVCIPGPGQGAPARLQPVARFK